MPELPEVETTVSFLRERILGLKIVGVWLDAPKLIKNSSVDNFKEGIKKSEIKKIFRLGKNIIFELDKNRAVLIHQKMTGHLLFGKWIEVKGDWKSIKKGPLTDPMNRFLHLIFFLNNGYMLALSDLRKFAKVIFDKKEKILALPEIKNLGPDVLKIDFKKFKERLLKRGLSKIKQVLMDQEVISGIGNIYADEILFLSKVNPFKLVKDLEEKDLKIIFKNTNKILKMAIKLKGTSISDYRIPNGKKGNFEKIIKVYRKKGQKCPSCGGIIKRKKIGVRSAHFCSKCQSL